MTEKQWDVVVVGGGPAGLSAALMLGRARRRVAVVDAGEPRNRFAAHMHGVLGHEGLAPADLIARGRAEVAAYGVELVPGAVARVEREATGLRVALADGQVLAARALVVATGVSDDLPDVPGLAERWGRSVLHCPYCHGWEVRDRRLGVLLLSPMGLHQAELVRQWSDRVTVFAGEIELEPAVEQRLRARGVEVVASPVVEVVGEGEAVTAVRTADGRVTPVDAIFTTPRPRPQDGFLADLGLDRADGPLGSLLAVDATGRTSDERVWAAGNVVTPMANVPLSIGAGSFVGGAVNGALVTEEFDNAESHAAEFDAADSHAAGFDAAESDDPVPAAFWEDRYAGSERVWSGRPNATLADVVAGLAPGRALDLGCGEGGDVLWLARQGWVATGLDIAPTAVRRATEAAAAAGLPQGRARFEVADLETWAGEEQYDLVTASFLQSPVALGRAEVLRRAAERVAPGGHLLVVSHAAPPPWAGPEHAHDGDHADAHAPDGAHAHHAPHLFPSPQQDLDALRLDPAAWTTVLAEVRGRPATGPDGQEATLEDAVVLVRRH